MVFYFFITLLYIAFKESSIDFYNIVGYNYVWCFVIFLMKEVSMNQSPEKTMTVEDIEGVKDVLRSPCVLYIAEDKEGIKFLAYLKECAEKGLLCFRSDMLVSAVLQNQIWGYTHGVVALTFCNINELLKMETFLNFVQEGIIEKILPKKTKNAF
ncbi:MAG: hypothetical protein KBC41_03165 [Candidatus Pacebacteria bacterium]|nr:hypothetical protein [Candidatus Paceibacterota bacterium]MBP9867048.1 hypothetical protein [Candidatus Paceibacterota bacterium]